MCLNNSFHYVSHDVFIQARPVNVQCKFENRKGLSSTFSITNSKTPTHTYTLLCLVFWQDIMLYNNKTEYYFLY